MKPKWLPVGLVVGLQVAWMVGTSLVQERSLVHGAVVLLETQPVDPRDFLRGDYVILNYKISDVSTALFTPPLSSALSPGTPVYVTLAQRGKFHQVEHASTEQPKAEREAVVLKGTARYQWDDAGTPSQVRVEYGLERYYVSEGSGNARGKMTVEVAVNLSRKGIIKQVYVDGVPFADAARAEADGSSPPSRGTDGFGNRATRSADRTVLGRQIPPRDPRTARELLDLTAYYNAALTNSWEIASGEDTTGKDLDALPPGVQTLAGTPFDVRGILQLNSSRLAPGVYPHEIRGIKARVKCRSLRFLHATRSPVRDGIKVASITIHYADSRQATIPIVCGENVRDCESTEPCGNAVVAWSATNATSRLGLYKCGWLNERPEVEITTVDYVSEWTEAAPFLIAITAD